MVMEKDVFNVSLKFIENSIDIGIKISEARIKGDKPPYNHEHIPSDSDLTNIYFVGQGLCLDVKDGIGTRDVITLSWDSECFGYFSGGTRRLLSISILKKLQKLMDLNEINYEPKEILA